MVLVAFAQPLSYLEKAVQKVVRLLDLAGRLFIGRRHEPTKTRVSQFQIQVYTDCQVRWNQCRPDTVQATIQSIFIVGLQC